MTKPKKEEFIVREYAKDSKRVLHVYKHTTFKAAQRQIKGLNLSMETVDAPYQKITLHHGKKLLYAQEYGSE